MFAIDPAGAKRKTLWFTPVWNLAKLVSLMPRDLPTRLECDAAVRRVYANAELTLPTQYQLQGQAWQLIDGVAEPHLAYFFRRLSDMLDTRLASKLMRGDQMKTSGQRNGSLNHLFDGVLEEEEEEEVVVL